MLSMIRSFLFCLYVYSAAVPASSGASSIRRTADITIDIVTAGLKTDVEFLEDSVAPTMHGLPVLDRDLEPQKSSQQQQHQYYNSQLKSPHLLALPTARPSPVPSLKPISSPTTKPTNVPTARPTFIPTSMPTASRVKNATIIDGYLSIYGNPPVWVGTRSSDIQTVLLTYFNKVSVVNVI